MAVVMVMHRFCCSCCCWPTTIMAIIVATTGVVLMAIKPGVLKDDDGLGIRLGTQ